MSKTFCVISLFLWLNSKILLRIMKWKINCIGRVFHFQIQTICFEKLGHLDVRWHCFFNFGIYFLVLLLLIQYCANVCVCPTPFSLMVNCTPSIRSLLPIIIFLLLILISRPYFLLNLGTLFIRSTFMVQAKIIVSSAFCNCLIDDCNLLEFLFPSVMGFLENCLVQVEYQR